MLSQNNIIKNKIEKYALARKKRSIKKEEKKGEAKSEKMAGKITTHK